MGFSLTSLIFLFSTSNKNQIMDFRLVGLMLLVVFIYTYTCAYTSYSFGIIVYRVLISDKIPSEKDALLKRYNKYSNLIDMMILVSASLLFMVFYLLALTSLNL